jgi:lysophospholipase L1-like esterase
MFYSPQGEQVDALREMIAIVRSHGAEPVLVAMPLSDHYYVNFDDPADYQKYRVALQQLADELHAPLWDMEALTGDEQFGDAEFGDLNHLNHTGAERLSGLLARAYTALAPAQEASNATGTGTRP